MFNYINEYKNNLISFEDDNEIQFNKSLNTLLQATHTGIERYYHNFSDCEVGDPIYIHGEHGFNTKVGKIIGFCVIAAGQIDDLPRFAEPYDWCHGLTYNKALYNFGTLPSRVYKMGEYIPSMVEIERAYINGNIYNLYEKIHSYDKMFCWLNKESGYWTSDESNIDNDKAYMFMASGDKGSFKQVNKSNSMLVRPFFRIPELRINESLKLMQIDNAADILFNKSKQLGPNIKYDIYGFWTCEVGTPLYYDDQLKFNLLDGELIGYCCVKAGLAGLKPQFMYKDNLYTPTGEMMTFETISKVYVGWISTYLKIPGDIPLYVAIQNGCLQDDALYWCSHSDISGNKHKCYNGENGHSIMYGKRQLAKCRPFIEIPNITKYK